jgi:hypothetical protein
VFAILRKHLPQITKFLKPSVHKKKNGSHLAVLTVQIESVAAIFNPE